MSNLLLSGGILASMANPDSSAGAAAGLVGLVFILIFVLLALGSVIVWIWSLIDLLRAQTPSDTKILWLLVIVFLGIIGSLLYIFIQRPKNAPNS